MWRGVAGCAALATVLAGCSIGAGRRSLPIGARAGAVQVGIASWYGPGFHGKPTASGEIYDQFELTAAHQTLPLGTQVAVTNMQNGKQVEVRVNDRGPFVEARVIDLSYAAARALGMIGPGTVPVRIEVLGAPAVQFAPIAYTIQVGAFTDRDRARRLEGALAAQFDGVYVTTLQGNAGPYYRVRLGRFARREEAAQFARSVAPLGLPTIIVEDGGAR